MEWVLCFIRIGVKGVGALNHQDSIVKSGYFNSSG